MKFIPHQGNPRTMKYSGKAFTNHNPECIGTFFFLSKQLLINNIDLPKASEVNTILAANATVTLVIIEKNRSDTLTQEM